jgi:ABC-type transport system involved in multi-copper enzyme maturation permease subunit
MLSRRFRDVFRIEFLFQLRRPLFWVMVGIACFVGFLLASGDVMIGTGDSDIGGQKAFTTSQFMQAAYQSLFFQIVFGFFFAVAGGMPPVRDEEERVGEILHASGLKPSEYVWGKFLGAFTAFCIAYGAFLLVMVLFNHVVPNAEAEKFHGPFAALNYLKPALMFCLPSGLFLSGVAFAIGAKTRKPIPVFVVPVVCWVFVVFVILGPWIPEDISLFWDRVLICLDPSGFRWLTQTYLKVDRGVKFYNTQPIIADGVLVLSRLAFAATGLLAVAVSARAVSRRLRGPSATRSASRTVEAPTAAAATPREAPELHSLAMGVSRASWWRQTIQIARVEARNLLFQPGLYLFVPLILLQTIGPALFGRGWLDSEMLVTSGLFVVQAYGQGSFWLIALVMFYTVESLQRERGTRLAPFIAASPVRTIAILAGKALANSVVVAVVLVAVALAGILAVLVQGKVPVELLPYALVFGLFLIPTFLLWSAFTSFVFCITRNRWASYAICLAVLIGTGVAITRGWMSWATNWPLWGALQWSDISVFEFDRPALILNRLAAVFLAGALVVLSVRFYPRIEADPQQTLHRLAPRPLSLSIVKGLAVLAIPLILIGVLALKVQRGSGGSFIENRAKEYRQKNFITYFEAEVPAIDRVELKVKIDPPSRSLESEGSYRLVNHLETPLARFPVTPWFTWQDLRWTLDGKAVEPEDRAGLKIFTPAKPLAPGESTTLGFSFRADDKSITKNGGGATEFVQPSSVVLTSFSPSFVPVIGFVDGIGVTEETRLESRDFPPGAHVGVTPSAFGVDRRFHLAIEITGPADFSFHSVGHKVADTTQGEWRTVRWETDYPVTFFNIVGGRWERRDGEGTELYYDRRHHFNIEEMGRALDGSRKYYGEWFYPYPWKTLKVSEFAALATYAQGFPTNITFSEGIGFLTKSDVKSHAAFLVTAHEAAHQWWGNLINPGRLPGGNLLSEGTAHYATVMLIEQMLGEQARIETLKRLEERYANDRQVDSERPMNRIDGTRAGDRVVTYERAGWVWLMLQDLMGREQNLAGVQEFFRKYVDNPDHPVIEDFVETLRPFAPDPIAFDAFVEQWVYGTIVPEFQLHEVERDQQDQAWIVTGFVENVGSGQVEVDVAATAKPRFQAQTDEQAAHEPAPRNPEYREQRTRVRLGPGERVAVSLRCEFEPEQLVVDPDVRVLQLRRKGNTIFKF